jgi:hypothetical protein
MKSPVKLAALVAFTLLAAGCSSLTQLPMYWGNNPASPDIKPTGYHADTKTGWMSYNDNENLYFAFTFFDPRIQTNILRTGMTIFIDTTCKMKEGCYVRFPMIKREILAGGQAGQKIQPRQGQGRRERTSTEMLLDQAQAFELQWVKGKDTLEVNPSTDKTGFKTSVGLDSTNALNMVVGVPLKLINPNGLAALSDIVVGLRFGQSPPMPGGGAGSPPRMSSGGQQSVSTGSGAGSGGGSGGRGRRGGGGGASSGGGSSAGAQRAQMMADMGGGESGPVEYWYKTAVIKK